MQSLQETLLYGLKGMAAYASHARRLGKTDPAVNAFIEEALFATMTNVNFDLGRDVRVWCWSAGGRTSGHGDAGPGAHRAFGKPVAGQVKEGTQAGPGILVTGHDLLDLEDLLRQCEGTDVKVYTHGEMLPAHMYPKLRKHPNLAGHYGGAWQKQQREFDALHRPDRGHDQLRAHPAATATRTGSSPRGVTAVPGGTRLKDDDFRAVVDKARQLPAAGRRRSSGESPSASTTR